ncbi:MAG: HAD-IIIA family hydrolase [bacterium]|nr:HAD-IIIA family hydrolase [bacterium]
MSDQHSKSNDLKEKIDRIKAILLDVDGVLTNGSIVLDFKGREVKFFNVQDGLGIYLARRSGLIVGIITGRESHVVKHRAGELNMDFLSQGAKNKLRPLEEFKKSFNVSDDEICFVGDDLLDMPIMVRCGFPVSVKNGRDEIKEISDYVTEAEGGLGAVREAIELILKSQGKWDDIILRYKEK